MYVLSFWLKKKIKNWLISNLYFYIISPYHIFSHFCSPQIQAQNPVHSLLHLVWICTSEEKWHKITSCLSQRKVWSSEELPRRFEFMQFVLLWIYFHIWNNAIIFLIKSLYVHRLWCKKEWVWICSFTGYTT